MGDSTPICRCRVLYLGSAVPRQSKDGLQGIQEPLRSLYPSEGAIGAKGIDSWLSVWSNGILLENVDENRKQVTRFFPIESLHYCAAVRQVLIPERGNSNPEPKFLPLDSPFARMPKAQHPPIFAAILRRTTGIKVLECHVFICKREAAANALVRCCFHAYADNSYARQLEGGSVYGTLGGAKSNGDLASNAGGGGWRSRAGSTTTLNSLGRQSNLTAMNGNGHHHMNGGGLIGSGAASTSSAAEGYTAVKNLSRAYNMQTHEMNGIKDDRSSHVYASSADLDVVDDGEGSIYNGDENHKVWNSSQDRLDAIGTESPYEIFSGNGMNGGGGHSTLGRPQRARQISAPIPVPPPPLKNESKKKKDKKSNSKHSSSQSLSGTLIRPKPIHPALNGHAHHAGRVGPPPPTGSMIYGPIGPMGPQQGRQFHTFSHRAYAMNGGPAMHHSHGVLPPTHHHQMLQPHPMGIQMHHQMPIMMPPQYATLQPPRTSKKKKKDKLNGIPVGMPVPPPIFAYHQQGPPPPGSMLADTRPLSMSNRKLAQSAGGGLDDSGSGAESPGGTGIYRRKGHLNERAFSYSIRAEHRSRSHGSLASLQFNPPDMKKEREIAQMVAGLELNDEATLHRRQHAAAMSVGGPSGTFGKPRR